MIFRLKKITLNSGKTLISAWDFPCGILESLDPPAIVAHIPVTNRHAHIDHNILTVRVVDDASEHLPRVQERIAL